MPGDIVAISGINAGFTSAVYRGAKEQLKGRSDIVFVGNPYRGWPHPLLWGERHARRSAVSRLMMCWAELQRAIDEARQYLAQNKIVVMQRGGADTVTWAVSVMPSYGKSEVDCRRIEQDNIEAKRLHHDVLVPGRLSEFGVRPPKYAVVRAQSAIAATEWMDSTFRDRRIDSKRVAAFLAYEQANLAEYFDQGLHKQRQPLWLDIGERTKEDLRDAVLQTVGLINSRARRAKLHVA